MHVSVIIVAAGKGKRLNLKVPKALIRINSQPIIIRSLKAFQAHPLIKDIIVVVNPKNAAG